MEELTSELTNYFGLEIIDEFLSGLLVKKCERDLGENNPLCVFLGLFNKLNSVITHSIYSSPVIIYILLCLYPFKYSKYLK